MANDVIKRSGLFAGLSMAGLLGMSIGHIDARANAPLEAPGMTNAGLGAEANCGSKKDDKEATCGADKGTKEATCGADKKKGAKEATCGADKKKGAKEATCGADKKKGAKDATCGEKTCG